MGRTKKVQSSEAELLEAEPNGEVVVFTPDQQKEYDNAIIKLTPGEEKVKEVQKYRELTLDKEKWFQGEQDDEMYEKIHAAIADCRGYRQTIDPDVKLINAPFRKIIKDTRDKGEWIKSQLLEVEEHLHSQKDPIDDEKKRISDENKAKKAARFIVRNQELTKLGASFINGFFILNDVSYSVADIEGIDDDIYVGNILPLYKAEWQKAEDIRLVEKKKNDDAADELKKQQDELNQERERLRLQKEGLDKAEKERNDLIAEQKKEKSNTRCKQLELLGMIFSRAANRYEYEDAVIHMLTDIETHDDVAWTTLIDNISTIITAKKKIAEEEQKKKEVIIFTGKNRKSMLSFFKFVNTSKHTEEELGKMDEDAFNSLHADYRSENTKKEHEKWLADEAEKTMLKNIEDQKKLNESSDNVKWKTVLDYLKQTPIVEMKSKKYQEKWNFVRDFLSDMNAI